MLKQSSPTRHETTGPEITSLYGEAKLVLDETPKAVSPFGGLASFISFLGQIEFARQVQAHLQFAKPASNNAIPLAHTLTAFLISVVVRKRVRETKAAVGRTLIDLPGYTFRVWVTNRPEAPLELWRDYNARACVEQRIEELKRTEITPRGDGFVCLQSVDFQNAN